MQYHEMTPDEFEQALEGYSPDAQRMMRRDRRAGLEAARRQAEEVRRQAAEDAMAANANVPAPRRSASQAGLRRFGEFVGARFAEERSNLAAEFDKLTKHAGERFREERDRMHRDFADLEQRLITRVERVEARLETDVALRAEVQRLKGEIERLKGAGLRAVK
ncbi:hypothetical protein [Sinorhizobium mexicanum]|uniref:Uncharacterized protein n=1 Tax=Sinorhizobium mexicanum TaxID=375549 RepID=A0A859QD00_9HYPH|nr:hypothetical protein [Sinorhizobium mexicanum]MBP1881948.1 type II secretory pathway component PulM [Sinorhizobium mexicanum]QLL61682.1 hypothetical protein FKV68_09600 [Sinorhizobium mexicanum]